MCILADASQLERSLFMLADYAGINIPAILLLNLVDIAEEQGKKIDASAIEKQLGIPVVPFVAADRKNYEPFHKAINQALEKKATVKTDALIEKYNKIEGGIYTKIHNLIPSTGIGGYSSSWLAAKIFEVDSVVVAKVREYVSAEKQNELDSSTKSIENGALITGGCKFKWIDEILQGAVSGKKESQTLSKFDKLAMSKKWGKFIAVLILLGGLVGSFIPAAPIMVVGMGISSAGGAISEMLNPQVFRRFWLGLSVRLA